MAIVRTAGAAIPNRHNPTPNQKTNSHQVIAQLVYANLWQGAGLLQQNAVMRVDMQGQIHNPDRSNIQVQVNNMQGASTVACVLVAHTLMTNDPQNQQGVAHAVIGALNMSLDNGLIYSLSGTAP
jgi:hypothetical protein